jgi:hypothetical protein
MYKQKFVFFQKFSNTIIDIMFEILLAYILYILVDKPFNNIYELILNRKPVEDFYDKDNFNNNNNYETKL